MPLIIITGYPTSGKTHRAEQVVEYFQSRLQSSHPHPKPQSEGSTSNPPPPPPRVHHITDAQLHIARAAYDLSRTPTHTRSANASEKDARATVLAAVKRVLGPRDVVVLDAAAGSYIKGWRYQLWCEAKAVRSTCCVVRVGTAVETARGVNEERQRRKEQRRERSGGGGEQTVEGGDVEDEDEEPYEPAAWENLVFRYEEPSGMTRWDRPLFTVLWDDAGPPCAAIWDAVMGTAEPGGAVVVKPHQATVLQPATGEGYLYELDRVTRDVVEHIIQWTTLSGAADGGGIVDVSIRADDVPLLIQLPIGSGAVGVPALQRLRRQFIALNRRDAVKKDRIRESFVRYLNDSFGVA